jgi:hypothetical protein
MISHDLCKVDFTHNQSEDLHFPHWPCPACGHGVLQLAGRSSVHFVLSAGMAAHIELDPLGNFEAHGVFCATMVCVNAACRQGVLVTGNYSTHTPDGMYVVGGRYDFPVERKYVINAIHPAVRLITIPQSTPPPILAPLTESFALYWGHPQVCAASLRMAIEGITDHLGQPREVNGKFIALAQRLLNLTPQHPTLAKVATAIKDFGNIGAHGNTVEREKLLAAYELIEIELRALFEDMDSRRDILIDQLKT